MMSTAIMARVVTGRATASALAVVGTDGEVTLVVDVYDRVPALKFKFAPINT